MNSKRFRYENIPFWAMVISVLLMVIGMIASETFLEIISKPDNVPIAAMLIIVEFFTWLALKQAAVNDQHTGNGQREKIYEEMIR